MAGHSHFSSIKHKKAIADLKRGKIFSKLARQISVAAREKGGDIETNPYLRMAVEKAKSFNMPKENIERAIKRGTGEIEGEKLEEFIFEAYGPKGIAIIIQGITDNKNRTLGEVKQILAKYNGKLATPGSVMWLFEKKGCITIKNSKLKTQNSKLKEDLELKAIEAGAEDIYWHNDILDVYTKIQDLERVKKNLENQGIKTESADLEWVAKDEIQLDKKNKQTIEKLFEELDENNDIQEIYSNLAS